jgi:hypothetical protein
VSGEKTKSMLQLCTFQLCPLTHRRLVLADKGVAAEQIEIAGGCHESD